MGAFHYNSFAQEVIFGAGSLQQLKQAIDNSHIRRVMLCANRSMRRAGHVDTVQSILGDSLVATFDEVHPHVQDSQVQEVLALGREHRAESVIGMGGGSPIGMAKAAAAGLAENRVNASAVRVIAIPTTYAGSEMTPVYGITHTNEDPPRKVTVNNPKIVPKLVIYDPNLTLDLPAGMTASTGINALAHCIEALYSLKRHPVSTAAAIRGVKHAHNAILRCYQNGADLDARSEMLLGSHMAGLSLASVTMGLHHGLCHVLGGSAGVPHGIANAMVLPHVIRFNADATAAELLPAAEAMGISINGSSPIVAIEAMAEKIYELIGAMNLPQHLREANVKESDLPGLAQLAFENRSVRNNPKPITDVAQIEKLLRAAW
jgi:maleylacetate reductase